MVAKTIDDAIPNWLVRSDQKRLPQRNPNLIHDQETTREIADAQVIRLVDGRLMFAKPLP
jgi:hypothetical protein